MAPPKAPTYVLVTGATGFIGAHVVDSLLARGLRVRGATRSAAKGDAMLRARRDKFPAGQLNFVVTGHFSAGENAFPTSAFEGGIDAVIHVASPLTYTTTDNEKELIVPAINGVKSVMEAATSVGGVKRVVLTSSFAAVIDLDRSAAAAAGKEPYFTYTGADWNPLTYKEAAAPETSAVVAYRGSKKFAELAAWDFVRDNKPGFDLVTLCPPMTFGPVVNPIKRVSEFGESNAMLWKVASGEPLPVSRVPFWVDVRDLAEAHVEALLRPEAGGKRYIPASPERFSYSMAAEIMIENFKSVEQRRKGLKTEEQTIDDSHGVDGEAVARELGVEYGSFRDMLLDFVAQADELEFWGDRGGALRR
ncbi:NAD dependent epimerase/dehydratase [Apodospora peruviana]|uniref:NAD dependent epimerase/dehydratase n=1 Tax=Apodospora peruviana TaxID=516989 RepID=A0AAE0IHE2_9PEZI|nr:NAD dependent epimerase/dehydratase [Apodospora peruviana]